MKKSLWTEKIRTLAMKEMTSDPFMKKIALTFDFYVSSKVNTLGVINNSLILNPSFISSLSKTELTAVVKHEIYHSLGK